MESKIVLVLSIFLGWFHLPAVHGSQKIRYYRSGSDSLKQPLIEKGESSNPDQLAIDKIKLGRSQRGSLILKDKSRKTANPNEISSADPTFRRLSGSEINSHRSTPKSKRLSRWIDLLNTLEKYHQELRKPSPDLLTESRRNRFTDRVTEKLRNFRISEELEKLYAEKREHILYAEDTKADIAGICKQLGHLFQHKAYYEDASRRKFPPTNVMLGLRGDVTKAALFASCGNSNIILDILIGPIIQDKRYYFIEIKFDTTRNDPTIYKVFEYFYTLPNGKIRVFQMERSLTGIIGDCAGALKNKGAEGNRKYWAFPTEQTKEIFRSLSNGVQSGVNGDANGENNAALLEELCREISSMENLPYHDSVYSRVLSEHHTIRLDKSGEKKRDVPLYGKCIYQKYGHIVYVYEGLKTEKEEKYLLAIEEGDKRTVAVHSIRADISKQVVYF